MGLSRVHLNGSVKFKRSLRELAVSVTMWTISTGLLIFGVGLTSAMVLDGGRTRHRERFPFPSIQGDNNTLD